MNIPCGYKSICIDDASALGNYSAETPDRNLFRSTYYRGAIWDGPYDIWLACHGLCVSEISQAAADLCAVNLAEICLANKLFGNEEYTCYITCPDGSRHSFTIPQGTFYADTLAQAQALAREWCSNYLSSLCDAIENDEPPPIPILPKKVVPQCNDEQSVEAICVDGRKGATIPACTVYGANKEAANERARSYGDELFSYAIGCLTPFTKAFCKGDYVSQFIVPDHVAGFIGRPNWTILGEPAGLSVSTGYRHVRLYGTLNTPGIFGFRIELATTNAWTYRVYYVSVMEIDEPPVLPTAVQDQPYSHSISVQYGWDPKTFHLKAGDTLPDGLELTTDGTIQGTPTGCGTDVFTVVVTDAEGAVCEKEFTLNILCNFWNSLVWTAITSQAVGGVASASGAGESGSIATQIPSGNLTHQAAGDLYFAAVQGTINNDTGAARNCRLTVTVNRSSEGIQNGSDALYLENDTLGAVIANYLGGTVPNGVHTYDFVVPPGIFTFIGHFKCAISVSGVFHAGPPPYYTYPGGSDNWSVQIDIIP